MGVKSKSSICIIGHTSSWERRDIVWVSGGCAGVPGDEEKTDRYSGDAQTSTSHSPPPLRFSVGIKLK